MFEFRQIGQADELGSGMRKLLKYGKAYGNADPELVEGDIFRIVVKIPEFKVTGQVTEQVQRLLQVFEKEHSRGELQTRLGLKHRDTFTEVYLNQL